MNSQSVMFHFRVWITLVQELVREMLHYTRKSNKKEIRTSLSSFIHFFHSFTYEVFTKYLLSLRHCAIAGIISLNENPTCNIT